MKTLEAFLALPFIAIGFLWELVSVGFRAGRMLYSMVFKP